MNWEPIVSVCLPPPVSANRYWRTRVVLPSMDKIAAALKQGGIKGLCAFIAEHSFVNTYVSAEAKAYTEEVGWRLRNAGVRRVIDGRVRIDLQLHPHCPQDWRTRARKDPLWWADSVQRLDADNCIKVLSDALIGVALADDKQVWKLTSEVMEPRPDVPACVVVRICRGIKEQPQAVLELPEPARALKEVAFP
jgi:crossover junction endodeoxyribonuclease RusA